MARSRISVTIDHLVLSGFEPTDGKAVAEGLKRELSRVLSEPSTRAHWASSGNTPVLRLPAMGLETGTSGRRKFGAGIARQIGKGLK
jgi:hypothetical protein